MLRQCPNEARLLAEIEGQVGFVGFERCPDLFDGRRFGCNELGIVGEPLHERRAGQFTIGPQLFDLRPQVFDRCTVALGGGRGQEVVENPQLSANLFLQILLGPRQLGQRRVARGETRSQGGERTLHRLSANDLGQSEAFGRCVASSRCQQRHVGFDYELNALLTRRNADRVVLIA